MTLVQQALEAKVAGPRGEAAVARQMPQGQGAAAVARAVAPGSSQNPSRSKVKQTV